MLTICKRVPIPKQHRPNTVPRRKYPLDEMDVGDMFFVPNLKKNTLTSHISTAGRTLGRKFTTRLTHMRKASGAWELAEPGTPGAVQGVGVWRVE